MGERKCPEPLAICLFLLLGSVKHPLPQWPQVQLLSESDQVRSRYIEAMKAADKEDYRELMAFMKKFVE